MILLLLSSSCGGSSVPEEQVHVALILDVSSSVVRQGSNAPTIRAELLILLRQAFEERLLVDVLVVGSVNGDGRLASFDFQPTGRPAENDSEYRDWVLARIDEFSARVQEAFAGAGDDESDLLNQVREGRRILARSRGETRLLVVSDLSHNAGGVPIALGGECQSEFWARQAAETLSLESPTTALVGIDVDVVQLTDETLESGPSGACVSEHWSELFDYAGASARFG
jgi:hypothetical protein